MLQLDLEVGQSVVIDSVTLTIVEIDNNEVCFKIDDDEQTMIPVRISSLMPRVPK